MVSTGILQKLRTENRNATQALENKQTDSFAYSDGIDEFNEYNRQTKHEICFAQKRCSMSSLK
jgi:hypothetical protein